MKRRTFQPLAIVLVLLLLLSGCSKSMESNSMPRESSDGFTFSSESYGGDLTFDDSSSAPSNQPIGTGELLNSAKMIYTANVNAQTTDFDGSYQQLQEKVDAIGGYFERSELSNSGQRCGYFTLRIPAERFMEFYSSAGQDFHVTNQDYEGVDVSESYYDLEARLSTQRTKLQRLQALLEKAENMSDIITIESAISETELQIEYYTGSLRGYDAKIQYATVYFSLREVSKLSNTEDVPIGYGARLGAAFQRGLRGFVNGLDDASIWLAENWLPLLVWVGILCGLFFLGKKLIRKSKFRRTGEKKESSPEISKDDSPLGKEE